MPGTFPRLWQADFRSPTHKLVTAGDTIGRLLVHNTARTFDIASDYSLTAQSDSRSQLLQP